VTAEAPASPATGAGDAQAGARLAGVRGRAAWADFARGVSVVLVVLMHLYFLHYTWFFRGEYGAAVVKSVLDYTSPLRMPLFFLVSGFLASRAVERSWGSSLHGRILQPVYLFVLWLGVNIAIDVWRAAFGVRGEVSPWEYFTGNLLWPQTTLWYLYALVLFFTVTRLTREVPAPVVVIVGVMISVIGTTFVDGLAQNLLRSFVFYALAARAPQVIDRVVAGVAALRAWPALLLVLGAGAGYAALTALYLELWVDFGLYLLAGAAGVLFGLVLSARIGGHLLLAPVRYLGRHTLAIFLVHPFVFIAANDILMDDPDLADVIRSDQALLIAYPWLLLLVTVGLSVGLEAVAKLFGLRALFSLPRWSASGSGS
jgi:fucose 4-O-acetylase-like acetyltransferase